MVGFYLPCTTPSDSVQCNKFCNYLSNVSVDIVKKNYVPCNNIYFTSIIMMFLQTKLSFMTKRNYTKATTKILCKETSTHLFKLLVHPTLTVCSPYSCHQSTSYSVHRNIGAGKHVVIMATDTISKWVTQVKDNYNKTQH
jgi:hypothetical protein